MTVPVEPFASVYDDGSRIDVILARGRRGFEAYVADDHSLELFPSPRKAAVAISTTARGSPRPRLTRQDCAAGSESPSFVFRFGLETHSATRPKTSLQPRKSQRNMGVTHLPSPMAEKYRG